MRLATFIAVVICARAEFNLTRDVEMFIEQTVDLTYYSDFNPMRDLMKLQEGTGKYLNVGSHVGHFIAAAADVEFEDGSEEQNALRALHSNFWARVKDKRRYNYHNYEFMNIEIGRSYGKILSGPLWITLAESLQSMTNAKRVDRVRAKDEFISACESNIVNHRMLDYIDRVYRIECPITSDDDITRLIRAQKAFRHFEHRNKRISVNTSQYAPWEYTKSKKSIMDNFGKLTVQQANDLISELESTTFSSLRRFFYSVERNFDGANAFRMPCTIHPKKLANTEARFGGNRLLYLNDYFNFEEAMTAVCTNISTGGDEKRMKTIFQEANIKIQRIVTHVKAWIKKLYEHAVPRVGIEAARRYLDNKEFRNKTDYAKLAHQMWITIGDRESYDFYHKMLAAPTSAMDKWWSVQTLRDGSYTNLTNYNGVDVHVFRYDYHISSNREKNLTKWIDENQDVFRDILRSHLNSSSAEVMQALNDSATNKTLCSADLYNTAFLIGGISEDNGDLLMGKSSPLDFDRSTMHTLEYAENGRHWKLFFFV